MQYDSEMEHDLLTLSERDFQQKYNLSDAAMDQIRWGDGATDIDGWE